MPITCASKAACVFTGILSTFILRELPDTPQLLADAGIPPLVPAFVTEGSDPCLNTEFSRQWGQGRGEVRKPENKNSSM